MNLRPSAEPRPPARGNLDMDLVRTFVTGVRLGSFARAAERVGRSQSAVSLQMRRLEQQLGVRLFHREGRGLGLSDSGRTFFAYAERLLDLNDEALEALSPRDEAGEVRLGIPPDLAETWLPQMLGRFSRSHPGVAMEARVDRNSALLDDIAGGRLDIALVWDRNPPAVEAPGEFVAELPILWIGPDGPFQPEEGAVPLVVMGEPCLFRAHALARLAESGRDWRVTFTSSSLAGLWAATSAGLGLTIRTPFGLPRGLTALTHPGLPPLGTVCLRACLAEAPSSAVKRFAAILTQTIREAL
ncbi:LysR family transcriptional regulator [Ancylobacter sp. Lp-2]|uniref:LysR substrate-binding domain-containing protein n=1 Tax=Ancylobacter sp. Lp-2 TaxID=2881339 RepID=UPI001E64670A|nr:LysR substrate-binding domain-containing protein [Ancylobacter sp. Lp-2]MCB4771242.1 LysR family transcriptional regulator [Ancylobacter sp. Lp-2]